MNDIFKAIENSAIKIKNLLQTSDGSKSTSSNESGDVQLKLDIQSDIIIENEFKKVSSIKEIISEEKDNIVKIHQNGKYLVGYDPLDGSSLADVNLSVGSIYGIYENGYDGKDLIASCYVVYGPRVEMVVAKDNKTQLFRLINEKFEYIQDLNLNTKGNLNAPGSTQKEWFDFHKKLIDSFFEEGYRLRYSGGMVPDLHQILLKGGGVFSYPATKDKKHGKLRKVFEVFPFALVYEYAGGEAIDGTSRVLDALTPKSNIHDTMPCFFGSKYEISKVREVWTNTNKN